MTLPSLENLAYPVGDGDHPGGGHCAWLGGATAEEDGVAIVDQYAAALVALVDAAETGKGWSLSRPILFVVHQLCENALNVANGRHDMPNDRGHSLAYKMKSALAAGVYADLTPEQRQWCERFIEEIDPLTGRGFPGRYPDGTLSDHRLLDDVWCCINPAALRDAATMFANLTVLRAAELKEPASDATAP